MGRVIMAKRGQRYPYRVVFEYPNGVKARNVAGSLVEAASETAGLLRRGAEVTLIEVNPETRAETTLHSFTPDDMPEPEDDDYPYRGDTDHVLKMIKGE
jgi:hypothetical protein